MKKTLSRFAAVVIAAIVASGCTAKEPAREPGGDSTSSPATRPHADSTSSPAVDSGVAAAPRSWYLRTRALDLTGDGRADTVRLEATGTRPDSLRITLAFVVAGEEKMQEKWSGSDELAVTDTVIEAGPERDAFLRAQLDRTLAGVALQPLDAPGVKLMAEDSTVLATLSERPKDRISFSYGYETTVFVVWDAPRRRFVRLWSCC